MAALPPTPDELFRQQFRQQWIDFLSSPMGKALISSLASQMPWATADRTEHVNHHQKGQVLQWQLTMKFLQYDLCQPPKSAEPEILQNYPDEPAEPAPLPQPLNASDVEFEP